MDFTCDTLIEAMKTETKYLWKVAKYVVDKLNARKNSDNRWRCEIKPISTQPGDFCQSKCYISWTFKNIDTQYEAYITKTDQ